MEAQTTGEAASPTPPPAAPLEAAKRRAARLQFPRRAILLLIAYGLAWAVLIVLRTLLPGIARLGSSGRNLAEITDRLPASLALLGATLVLILIQTAILTLIAVAIHRLESRAGIVGSVLKGLGRLWAFSQGAAPVFVLAVLSLFVFAIQLRLLPPVWGSAAQRAGFLGQIPYLIVPGWCLALLPSLLTAQVIAREVTLPRESGDGRVWPNAVLKGLAALAGQVGGLLSGLVLVEMVFNWPGVGRLVAQTLQTLNIGIAITVAGAFATLVLLGRLAAELFRWLARLRPAAPVSWPHTPMPQRKAFRRIWVVAALVLLLMPACLALTGLATSSEAALRANVAESNKPPSAQHLLGTDHLGRDVWALLRRGGLNTVGMAVLGGVLAAIPGGLGGALVGWLASRRTLITESVADVLLLPAEAILMIPALPLAILLLIVMGIGSWVTLGVAMAIVLAPRLSKFVQALWLAGPMPRQAATFVAGAGSLLLAASFAAVWLVSSLGFMGVGLRPPTPTLGGLMAQTIGSLQTSGSALFATGLALGLIAFALFTAASALAGFFPSKEALARLNE
jgi:peptide/nickel transport system permease protein